MAIPKITINLQSGALGSVGGSNDGVCGLVIGCDPASSGITAGDKFLLRSYDDAITNSLSEIPYANQQIKEFFDETGIGSKLYVMVVANTVTLTDIADSTNDYATALLEYAQGTISLLGICRLPDAGYTPTVIKGLDDDVMTAVIKMQALAEIYKLAYNPFVGIIEGRKYQDVAADLDDLNSSDYNYVGIALVASDDMHDLDADSCSIGLLMGRAAALPVQRKIARVKDGGLNITGSYLGSKTTELADWASVADKNYIVIGTYANKTGYYFIDDTLATASTDDYKTICNRRVMNKLVRLVYAAYINELNDDIELDSDGKLSPAVAKYYEGLVSNAVNNSMTANGELSSFSALVDIDQNVLSTGKIEVKCAAVPKGYSQEIEVTLGFDNPAL